MKLRTQQIKKTKKVLFQFHHIILFILGIFFIIPACALQANAGEEVSAYLATDTSMPSLLPEKPFMAIILLKIKPGWHTYWQYPGDVGMPTKVKWDLPLGWKASPTECSIPTRLSEPGDLMIYGYEKYQLLRAMITPSMTVSQDQKIQLKASVSWLACKDLCVPGTAKVTCDFSDSTNTLNKIPQVDSQASDWPEVEKIPFPFFFTEKEKNKILTFIGQNTSSYSLYPDPPEGITVGHVTQRISTNDKKMSIAFSIPWDTSAAFRALLVEKNGNHRRAWWVNEKSLHDALSHVTEAKNAGIPLLIFSLFSGFLGGLILNLMPCVLPVISLKLFSFIAQAGESPKRILRHGISFSVGIFTWFLGLGILISILKSTGSQVTWGAFQFQNSFFIIGLSVLVFLFALNLFGVFEITLPGSATSTLDRTTTRGGYSGSFFQGLFATLLATPCTAPFLGSALGFACGQSVLVILIMFTSVAFGMSLPYLLLSARPSWRRWIPKPGDWMERLKQIMGFPLLATNLWLLWVLKNQRGVAVFIPMLLLFLILSFCAWLYGVAKGRFRLPILLFSILIAFSSLTILGKHINTLNKVRFSGVSHAKSLLSWVPYSASALDTLREQGKPVFLNFSASWCLTCQFNERVAINVPAVRSLFKKQKITPMKGDWTNADPVITDALKSFNRIGVPLSVYYPPGKKSLPIVLPELLSQKIVLETLEKFKQ